MNASLKAFTPERNRLDPKNSKGRNLAEVLAIAAEHNIPYERALRSMSPRFYPFIFEFLYSLLYPLLVCLKKNKRKGYQRYKINGVTPLYKSALDSAVSDLEAGFSLGYVLEEHFCWWLPEFYIKAVQLAEEKGTLSETIIYLSENLNRVKLRRLERFYLIAYPITFLIMVYFFYSMFFSRFLGKIMTVYDDITNGQEFPLLTQYLANATRPIYQNPKYAWIVVLQLPWIVYYFFYTRKGDWLLIKIPFIRRSLIRAKMIEAMQSLCISLKMKIPLNEAVDMIIDQLPECSLKNQFKRLHKDICEGKNFQESWNQIFKSYHLPNFYINSGIKVDRLPETLENVIKILHEEDTRKHFLAIKIFEPVSIICCGIIVGLIVVGFFQPLIKIIEFGSLWE